MRKRILHIILIAFLSFQVSNAWAQFYNGYQMDFGKNRVQYDPFEWKYYRQAKFDTYFYVDGEDFAKFTSKIVDKKIKEYETFFEFHFEERLIFQVYNNLSDFRQSNIGYISSGAGNNIGGTTTIIQNRAFVYFENDYRKFEQQISAAVAKLMINQMLFGGSYTAQMANSSLLSLPAWYSEGLVRYISEGWGPDVDDRTRDAILTGRFDKFNHLEGEEAILAGQSIWNFIAKRYGDNIIPNIIYLARVSKSVDSGFMFVLGMPFKYLTVEWLNYYKEQYQPEVELRDLPSKEKELHKTKKQRVYQQMKIAPNGKDYAYTSNEMGKYIVWLYNSETGKKKSIVRKEHRLQQITDYSYPLLSWHPSGTKLSYMVEEKGGIWLYIYELETKEIEKKEIFYFTKITNYAFSPDGKRLVFTGVKKGQTDVYTYGLLSNTHKVITNDRADEKDARFLKDNENIVFTSNRLSDSLKAFNTQHNYDLFVLNPEEESLKRITRTPQIDEKHPIAIGKMNFLYLTNQTGINNIAKAVYDSSISFIDTSIHYNYFSNTSFLTDYKRNVKYYSYNNRESKVSQIIKYQNKDRLFSDDLKVGNDAIRKSVANSKWKINTINKHILDSIQALEKDTVELEVKAVITKVDTSFIDFNDYQFDVESLSDDIIQADASLSKKRTRQNFKPIYYFTSFYNDKIVTQIDFGFLNQSYQAYTGSAVYFNPGFNVFTKMGVADMFDNYRFTAGLKVTGNLNSAEYLFSLEDLKKRLDKQYIFHRQALEDYSFLANGDIETIKTYSHQLMYVLKWPFNQVSAVRGTVKYRNDYGVHKSTSQASLERPDEQKNWAGLKMEYIFDNSISMGINLYRGWRSTIFAEAYKQVDGSKNNLFVLGFDFRHYQKIHRSFIWASRIAGSSSFGESRLMYYLGSTDNWINLSKSTPVFDESVKRNKEINWAFQALATNMRGFTQNVRNGNSFLVMNNELRLPLVRYFSPSPVTSPVLYNLQLVGFFDIGTAWTGESPYSEDNLYNIQDYYQPPVKIIIDNQKAPFVYGYGAGVRTKLLGYFIRADMAWGIDGDVKLPRIFYLSLSLDF